MLLATIITTNNNLAFASFRGSVTDDVILLIITFFESTFILKLLLTLPLELIPLCTSQVAIAIKVFAQSVAVVGEDWSEWPISSCR